MAKTNLTDAELKARAEAVLEQWVKQAEAEMFSRCLVLAHSELEVSERCAEEIHLYMASIQA